MPLAVGSEEVTVSVQADAPQIDTSMGTMSQVIGEQQVNELPLNGRNVATLTTLVAGVVIAPNAQADQGATKAFPVAVTITANGTQVGQTNYLLDGGNNVDEYTDVNAPFPMPDALQEFSVQTSKHKAQYGQNAGGVVNLITKSGVAGITATLSSSSATAFLMRRTTLAMSMASKRSIRSTKPRICDLRLRSGRSLSAGILPFVLLMFLFPGHADGWQADLGIRIPSPQPRRHPLVVNGSPGIHSPDSHAGH